VASISYFSILSLLSNCPRTLRSALVSNLLKLPPTGSYTGRWHANRPPLLMKLAQPWPFISVRGAHPWHLVDPIQSSPLKLDHSPWSQGSKIKFKTKCKRYHDILFLWSKWLCYCYLYDRYLRKQGTLVILLPWDSVGSQWGVWLANHVVNKRKERPDHLYTIPNWSQIFPSSFFRTVLIKIRIQNSPNCIVLANLFPYSGTLILTSFSIFSTRKHNLGPVWSKTQSSVMHL
jgi:hypothetical protein